MHISCFQYRLSRIKNLFNFVILFLRAYNINYLYISVATSCEDLPGWGCFLVVYYFYTLYTPPLCNLMKFYLLFTAELVREMYISSFSSKAE
jgi:hypothetical protein